MLRLCTSKRYKSAHDGIGIGREMGYFRGKVVVVTGSSNGIGRATAKLFAQDGAKVTITGRNETALKETRKLCLEAGSKEDDILEIIGDLGNEETPKRIIDETVKTFGGIDALVNNAGMVVGGIPTALNEPLENFDKIMAVNLRSVVQLSQLATPHLEKSHGSIVNVSSIGALPFSMTQATFYCMSKAGLDSLTVQQAGNLIKKGIRVNSVNPGVIETDIIRKAGVTEEQAKERYSKSGENRDAIPVGRCGQPEEVAKLIFFLSDPTQSSFIVGQRIIIDGGSSIQNCLLSTSKPV